MASGSQTCSGNWADLPTAPQKMSRMPAVAPGREAAPLAAIWVSCAELECPVCGEQQQDADQEAEVAEPGHQERLLRRGRRLGPLVPVADQQIRAQANELPDDVDREQVVREHESEHRMVNSDIAAK